MSLAFLYSISYVSVFSAVIPILVYLTKRNRDRIIFTILTLAAVSLLFDLANEIFVRTGGRGHHLINAYFIVQFAIVCFLYFELLSKNILILFVGLTYIIFFGVCLIFGFSSSDASIYRSIENAILLLFSLLLFVRFIQTLPTQQILKYSPLWINLAVWIYFGYNTFTLFVFSSYFSNEAENFTSLFMWSFHNISNIMKNLLFAVAVYFASRTT